MKFFLTLFQILLIILILYFSSRLLFLNRAEQEWKKLLEIKNQLATKIDLENKYENRQKKMGVLIEHFKHNFPEQYAFSEISDKKSVLLPLLEKLIKDASLTSEHIDFNHEGNTIRIQATGNYSDIQNFLQGLNKLPWPLAITKLLISAPHHIDITLSTDIHPISVFLPTHLPDIKQAATRDPFVATGTAPIFKQPVMHTEWMPLYFARATDVIDFLLKQSSTLLSPTGKLAVDARTNQIWIEDDKPHIARIRDIAHHLDHPGQLFSIKAKIVTIDKDYQKTLGFLFRTENNTLSATLTSDGAPSETLNNGEFTVSLAKLAGNHLLDLQISALEQEGHASIISDPSLTTLNNQAAVIESGAEVPYQESTFSGGTSVSFKKAVLRLKVTPQSLPNHNILLHISLNQDKVSTLTVKGVPAIQTQLIATQIIAHDHQTIVLGGILEHVHSTELQGIPIIGQIPMMGKLFQHHVVQNKERTLLIFITPHQIQV